MGVDRERVEGRGGANDGAEISARTRLVGVMGWPIEHSLSPAMHNAVLSRLGLDWRYVPLPVHPGTVEEAVRGAAALGFRGFNVTVPHKCAVMAALDEIAPEAAAVGAVNTVVIGRNEGRATHLTGYNTDISGFLGSLRAGSFEPEGGAAVVVGAGGAARSVVYGLMSAGMERITILNRTQARAERLARESHAMCLHREVKLKGAGLTRDLLVAATERADLLVNATTVGMWPAADASIWPDSIPLPDHVTVVDLVYNPLETRLLRQARNSGARTIDGLGMLARQGALALDLWMASPLDVDWVTGVMRKVCEHRLQR